MPSIWDIPFVVVDVETSGPNAEKNRLIDIACVKVLGGEIVSQFDSMVNPHQFIPYYIANMTGISNEIAFQAPEESQVMSDVAEFLNEPNVVFTAHNVNFDFSFVNSTLIRNGYQGLDIPKLCSLKLARRLIFTNHKKNVGSLAQYFGIPVYDRHRALGDAVATAKSLTLLMEKAEQEHNITTLEELLTFQNKPIKHFKPSVKSYLRVKEKLDILPKEPGVYYFLGRAGNILYVGKAKLLNDRVKSYFTTDSLTSRKIANMVKRVYDIKWLCTDTELAALILESKEIKKLQPPFNSADKSFGRFMFLRLTLDDYPVFEAVDTIEPDGAEYYGPFRSFGLTNDILELINKLFRLRKCEGTIKPNIENQPCIYYQMSRCASPCSLIQSKEEYHSELENVREFLSGSSLGIISKLEEKMKDYSEQMNYEKADEVKQQVLQLKKLFERRQKVPTSINKNNVIVIQPASPRDKTTQVLLIHTGKLIHQEIVGRKAPLEKIFKFVHNTYFNGKTDSHLHFSLDDINELKIITSWVNRQNGSGKFIYTSGKEEKNVLDEIELAIRNIEFDEN
jgi:DNA polymerase-3 subunit epsilon